MKTATLSPPPRPPRNENFTGGLGEPDGDGKSGRHTNVFHWCRVVLKFLVLLLFTVATAQLVFILFQTVRLWFFS